MILFNIYGKISSCSMKCPKVNFYKVLNVSTPLVCVSAYSKDKSIHVFIYLFIVKVKSYSQNIYIFF